MKTTTPEQMDALIAELVDLQGKATQGPLDNHLHTAKVVTNAGRTIYECKSPHPSERAADARLVLLLRNNLHAILDYLTRSSGSPPSTAEEVREEHEHVGRVRRA